MDRPFRKNTVNIRADKSLKEIIEDFASKNEMAETDASREIAKIWRKMKEDQKNFMKELKF